jgi:hypothetical protein
LKLLDAFLCKDKLPEGINHLLFCFSPKPSGDAGAQNADVVFKHPSETRPLSLKVADNKFIAAAINKSISPVIVKLANDLQRGFIHGRQMLQNNVDLDFHGQADILQFYGQRSSSDPGWEFHNTHWT